MRRLGDIVLEDGGDIFLDDNQHQGHVFSSQAERTSGK